MSWLEVLATPRKEGLPQVGECIALEGPGRHHLGRSSEGQIIVEVDGVNRRRSPLPSSRMNQWSLLALASMNETRLNGEMLVSGERVLKHGDVVEISGGLVLRYCAQEDTKHRSPVLESAIGDNPDDDARWRVYTDWLLERGDPLGQRMALGHDGGDDDARWLEAMARPWRCGNLELTWRHGFVRTARLRALEWEIGPDTYWCLLRLFELEVCRFVEEVHVDLFTTESGDERPPFETRARLILESIRNAPRTLKRIALGPVMQMAFPTELKRELNHLREERPRLLTDESDLVQRFSRMVLRDLGGGLDEWVVTHEKRTHRFGAESLALTLGKFGVAWAERIEPRSSTPFHVNGRPVWQARLLHGDILEPVPGTRLVVEVS